MGEERERFVWLLRARHAVFARVPVDTDETKARIRALLDDLGYGRSEEDEDRARVDERIRTGTERTRLHAYDIAQRLGHNPYKPSLVLKPSKSGLIGATAYVDACTAQGMIETLLRYPPSHPHACPACEPPVSWDGEASWSPEREQEVSRIERELIRRWQEGEKKLVAGGDPSSCPGNQLSLDAWRAIWRRRRVEGLPNVLPKEADVRAARADATIETNLHIDAFGKEVEVDAAEPEPELDPDAERVLTATKSATGEMQFAFARRRPKVPEEEDPPPREPMDPEEVRRAREDARKALDRVFLLGGSA